MDNENVDQISTTTDEAVANTATENVAENESPLQFDPIAEDNDGADDFFPEEEGEDEGSGE